MKMKTQIQIGLLITLISLTVLFVVAACTTQQDVELARMRRADAEARLASAQALGTVNVLEAETNAHLQKLRAETDVTKEIRQFDRDMAALQFADHLLELQALQIALVETREIIEPISHDSHAAAENSWWTLILLPLGGTISLICSLALAFYLYRDLRDRLDTIDERLTHGQDATSKGQGVRKACG